MQNASLLMVLGDLHQRCAWLEARPPRLLVAASRSRAAEPRGVMAVSGQQHIALSKSPDALLFRASLATHVPPGTSCDLLIAGGALGVLSSPAGGPPGGGPPGGSPPGPCGFTGESRLIPMTSPAR